MEPFMAQEMQEIQEISILVIPELSIYRIPHMKQAGGYFAADWGVEKDHGMPGSLRIVNRGNVLHVRIFREDKDSSEQSSLFANCPIKLNSDKGRPDSDLEFFVQGVKDSSRYFAIRVVHENTQKHAYIGIGFESREASCLSVFF